MKQKKLRKGIFLGLVLFAIALWGIQTGCGKSRESISLEEIPDEAQTKQGEETTVLEKEKNEVKQKEAGKEDTVQEGQGDSENGSGKNAVSGTLSVYVCGAVNIPGVYELPAGSRLYQAIDAAGGMREDADKNYLNLAMELVDGEKLQVPTQEEVLTGSFGAERTEAAELASGSGSSASKEGASTGTSGLVNINTADETLLMTLPGIGETKAKSIIAYRTENGSFAKIEDIMNIPGIKQAVYDKIKDAICIK